MESQSLKVLKVFATIAKILSKIVYVCSIIGVCFCGVGALSFFAGLTHSFKIGGMEIMPLISDASGISTKELCATLIAGALVCAGQIVVSKYAYQFFDNELKAGTPFTFEGAKELLRLGIITAAVPLACQTISEIVIGIVKFAAEMPENISYDSEGSVTAGVMCILISFILKYGAEQLAAKDTPAETEENTEAE
ncbi:MAG: hypothetical protein MJ121_06070 [Clostridia bacterium]|nr:hypothetical protein [Clostridia bacterium]